MKGCLIYILVNTLRPKQNGWHFTNDIFKCIFLNENVSISIKIWLKFVPEGSIVDISSLVQIMAWRRPGDMPLSEPMMTSLLMHICFTRPLWVNTLGPRQNDLHVAETIFGCILFTENFYPSALQAGEVYWMHISKTTGQIISVGSDMELLKHVVMLYHVYLLICYIYWFK